MLRIVAKQHLKCLNLKSVVTNVKWFERVPSNQNLEFCNCAWGDLAWSWASAELVGIEPKDGHLVETQTFLVQPNPAHPPSIPP